MIFSMLILQRGLYLSNYIFNLKKGREMPQKIQNLKLFSPYFVALLIFLIFLVSQSKEKVLIYVVFFLFLHQDDEPDIDLTIFFIKWVAFGFFFFGNVIGTPPFLLHFYFSTINACGIMHL